MKDWDVHRAARQNGDRDFKIGGETFTVRPSVRPEATELWEDVQPGMAQADVLAAIDATVLNLIEPGPRDEARKRWKVLRDREEDALTQGDLLKLVPWLMEVAGGRPTEPSSNSSGEPEPSGASSTGDSSSRATRRASKA